MDIKEKIENDLKQALINREELKRSVLRMLKSAIKNAEIEAKKDLTQDEVFKVLEKQAKQRKDSIEQYEKGNRKDLADKEKQELAIVEAYLPTKMSDDEIRNYIVGEIKGKTDINFGQMMGMVMKGLGAKADGQAVRKILEEEIKKSSE